MTLRNLTFGGAVIALAAIALPYGAVSAPATPAAAVAPARATLPLNKIDRPGPMLTKLMVVNRDGVNVGTVVDVVTQSDGKAVSLTVDTSPLYGGKRHWVGINAAQMGLDQTRRIVVANLTSAQIKALPSLL
jgi:hypothetical protein